MSAVRRVALFALLWFSCVPGAIARAEWPPGAGDGRPSLKMEELEVRGLHEKPGRLYLPAPRQILVPLPVRFDLFREDLARPVLPAEIANDGLSSGGTP